MFWSTDYKSALLFVGNSQSVGGYVAAYSGYSPDTKDQEGVAKDFMGDFKEAMKDPETFKRAIQGLSPIVVGAMVLLMTDGMGAGFIAEAEATAVSTSFEEAPISRSVVNLEQSETFVSTTNIAKTEETAQSTHAATNVRPSWQQTEADVVTSNYQTQVSFKNGNVVDFGTKGSVRPEGYDFLTGQSIEAKNYTIKLTGNNSSLIDNVVKQARQRISNLPKGSFQNIVIDTRGQGVGFMQQTSIKNSILNQTGVKNVGVSFLTD